jgi:hypothetical protein
MPGPSPLAPFIAPFERLALPEHRRRIELEEGGAWIAPPEYVILRKLEYLREGGTDKHARDIRFIVAGTPLDVAFLEAEVARLGLRAEWERSRK